MIRYPVSIRQLLKGIQSEVASNWRRRAHARTAEFCQKGEYFEDLYEYKPFWNELSNYYWRLQHGKCIYCERCFGEREMEIDHYRPKRLVNAWPSSHVRTKHSHLAYYDSELGNKLEKGYYALTYNPINLVLCCPKCNKQKRTFFPVSGQRVTTSERNVSDYTSEAPLLFYPLSSVDSDDPERCIQFIGATAYPAEGSSESQRLRARVTIDLLHLNERSELIDARCRVICQIYANYMLARSSDPEQHKVGKLNINNFTSEAAEHTNCARCFLRLCDQDLDKARQIFEDAWLRINSKQPR